MLKKKKKIKWKKRLPIIKKLRIRKKKLLVKKEIYKIIVYNLFSSFNSNRNIFINNNLYKYNPLFSFKNKFLKRKIKKKFIFLKFLKINNNLKNNLNNFVYNNYYPIYNSSYFLVKKFKNIFRSFFFKKYFNSFQFYVISFFEKFFNKNIFIKPINNNIFKSFFLKRKLKFNRIKKIYYKNKRSVQSRKNKFNLLEILEIILYSFYHKDVYILKNWFLRNYITLHYTAQKKFLSFFKILITDVFETYKHSFGINGFYFIVKGKVGVTSNAKKKAISFRIGPLSKSSKNQKIDFQQGVVKASSGTSGLLMILTYN